MTRTVALVLLSAAGLAVSAGCGDDSQAMRGTLEVLPFDLPPGLVDQPYRQNVRASGGSAEGYTWAISNGMVPPGLILGEGGHTDDDADRNARTRRQLHVHRRGDRLEGVDGESRVCDRHRDRPRRASDQHRHAAGWPSGRALRGDARSAARIARRVPLDDRERRAPPGPRARRDRNTLHDDHRHAAGERDVRARHSSRRLAGRPNDQDPEPRGSVRRPNRSRSRR